MDRSRVVVHELSPAMRSFSTAKVEWRRMAQLQSPDRSRVAQRWVVATWSRRAWCANALHNDCTARLSRLSQTLHRSRARARDGYR